MGNGNCLYLPYLYGTYTLHDPRALIEAFLGLDTPLIFLDFYLAFFLLFIYFLLHYHHVPFNLVVPMIFTYIVPIMVTRMC